MRFIKSLFSVVIILSLLAFSSCSKGELEAQISPSDKSLIDLASNIYDEAQLSEIAEFSGSINELNAKYPIECLRAENGIYRASYLGEEGIAVILFDASGNKISGKIHSAQLSLSDFDRLAKGQLLAEVKAVDPLGDYPFLYTGRNDAPKLSSHYTEDGYLITVEYDASNTVISINKELI